MSLAEYVRRVGALLRKVQWRGGCCPGCGGLYRSGHAPDCELKLLLAESEAKGAPSE